MANNRSVIAGITGAFALLMMSLALVSPAQAYVNYCESSGNAGTGDSGLPCLDAGNDWESSMEEALAHIYGYSIDVMQIAKVDVPDPWDGSWKYNDGLKVSGDWGWYAGGDQYSGSWKYYGDEEIAFVTIKAGNKYVIYNAAQLIDPSYDSYVKGYWNTNLISQYYGKWKGLSHLSIWKVVGNTQVPEPAPLALLLVGATFLAWRRRNMATA